MLTGFIREYELTSRFSNSSRNEVTKVTKRTRTQNESEMLVNILKY